MKFRFPRYQPGEEKNQNETDGRRTRAQKKFRSDVFLTTIGGWGVNRLENNGEYRY